MLKFDGLIRDNPDSFSLELKELSSINKVSLV